MSFDNAFIGYNNYFTATASTLTASGVDTGFNINSLKNWQAFDYVQFASGTNYAQIDCGSAVNIDFLAICAHELFTKNCTAITIKGSSDVAFGTSTTLATLTRDSAGTPPVYSGSYKLNTSTSLASQVVNDDPHICFKLDTATFRYYRLTFTCASAVKIGVMAIGLKMEFERGFYGGFMPQTWNEEITTTVNKSIGGIYLGTSIERSGTKPETINLEHLTHAWIEATWLPFRRHAVLYPFIFSWGNTPLSNNSLAIQKSFSSGKVQNRSYGSVGLTFEGTIK